MGKPRLLVAAGTSSAARTTYSMGVNLTMGICRSVRHW